MTLAQARGARSALVAAASPPAAAGRDDAPTEGGRARHARLVRDPEAGQGRVRAARAGLKLRILQGGDAGETLNRALLTKGDPQGDVLFGIDNNLLSRALDEGLFEPYEADGLDQVAGRATGSTRRAPRDADRPRRRLPQRRRDVVRIAAASRRRRRSTT